MPWPCLEHRKNWKEQERSKDQVGSRRLVPAREERSSRQAERRPGSSGRKRAGQIRRRVPEHSQHRKRALGVRTWARVRRPVPEGRMKAHTTEVLLVHKREPVGRMQAQGRRKGLVDCTKALGHKQVPGHKWARTTEVQPVRRQQGLASKKEPMERLHTEAEQERTRQEPVPVARRRPEPVERRRVLAVRTQLGQGRLRSFVVAVRTRRAPGQKQHKMIQHRKRQVPARKQELVERNLQHHRQEQQLHKRELVASKQAQERIRELVGCRLPVEWEQNKPQRAGGQRGLGAGCRTGKLGQASRDGEEARI